MEGHFSTYPQNYAIVSPYYIDEHGQQILQSPNYLHGVHQLHSIPPPETLQPGAFVDYEEASLPLLPAQSSARVRRRVGAGGEHIKFRRTRSGCYTCRNRRVKVRGVPCRRVVSKVHAMYADCPCDRVNSAMKAVQFVKVSPLFKRAKFCIFLGLAI